ncbi:hypothetical protein FRC00_004477 [Tulasnella sp. 408]|nr:hypothetical protein FRC00_004477 [Tulasnella sp. 408]
MSPLLRSLAIGAASSAGGSSMALPMDIVRRIVEDEVTNMPQSELIQGIEHGWPVRYGCVYDLVSQFRAWKSIPYVLRALANWDPGKSTSELDHAFLYAADVLLAYRALCLWRMNRVLVIFNVVIFLLSVIASAAFAGISISQFNVVATPKYLTGCWTSIPDYNFVAPVPGLLFEFWIFVLVLFRAFSFSRKEGLKMSRLAVVQMLFKDSMWWFSMITLLLVVNTLFLAIAPGNLSSFFIPLFRSFVIVFGCHLVLRMRRAAVGNSRLPPVIEMSTWEQQHKHQHPHNHGPPARRHTRNTSSSNENNTNSRTKFRIKCPYCRKLAKLGSRTLGLHSRDDDHHDSSNAQGRSISTTEAQRIERTLDIAQKMGLPPALHQDLMMWYDPLTTLNQNTTTVLELTTVSVPSLDQAGGVTSASEVDGTVTATSDERSTKKEMFLRSPRTRFGHHPKSSSLSAGSSWDYHNGGAGSPIPMGFGSGKADYEEDEEDGRVEFNVTYVLGEDEEEEGDVGVNGGRTAQGRPPRRGPGMA